MSQVARQLESVLDMSMKSGEIQNQNSPTRLSGPARRVGPDTSGWLHQSISFFPRQLVGCLDEDRADGVDPEGFLVFCCFFTNWK